MSRRSTKQRRAARKRRMEIAADRARYVRGLIWGGIAIVFGRTLARMLGGGRK